jgi:putative sterol carrier protein
MQHRFALAALALLMVLAVSGTGYAQQPSALRAGVAAEKITPFLSPERTVWLAGYEENRPGTSVYNDLWARAIAFHDGQRGFVLAVCDLMAFNRVLAQRVRAGLVESEALKAAGLKPEDVHIAATHTHSAPDTVGLWGPNPATSGLDPEYINFLVSVVIKCVNEAAAGLAPARLKVATGSAPGLSRNDRFRDILEACGVRDYASRDIPANVEVLDPEFAALQVLGPDGSVMATVVNWACHPEMSHTNVITADFPHWLRDRLEQQYGGIAIYWQGAQGGMITGNSRPDEDIDASERIGLALADRVVEALGKGEEVAGAPISAESKTIKVKMENEGFKAGMEAGVLPMRLTPEGEIETEVTHITVGPMEFVTIPGEALPNIGLMLKRHMTGRPRFIIGLCDDELGYILAQEDWGLALYEYETSMSVGSTMGRVMGDALLEMISGTALAAAPAASSGEKVQAFFADLPAKFRPEKAEGVDAVYQINLTGEGGGQWNITVRNQQCVVAQGVAEKPNMTIEADAADWLKIVAGEMAPTSAVLQGKLKLQPLELGLAGKFADLFF